MSEAFHRPERRTFPADEGDIADAIEFLAVGK